MEGHDWWLTGLLVAIPTALATIIPLLLSWQRSRAELQTTQRKDTIGEWQQLMEGQRTRDEHYIDDLTAQNAKQQELINGLQIKIDAVRAEGHTRAGRMNDMIVKLNIDHIQCVKENAELRTEIAVIRVQLHQTAKVAGVPLLEEATAVVIVDTEGMIVTASPAITTFLGWKPDELEGQNVSMLIPDRIRVGATAAFGKAAANNFMSVGGLKSIDTWALDRNGAEVAVTLSLKAWHTGKGDGLVTAVIRTRISEALKPANH